MPWVRGGEDVLDVQSRAAYALCEPSGQGLRAKRGVKTHLQVVHLSAQPETISTAAAAALFVVPAKRRCAPRAERALHAEGGRPE